eukprot:5714496-Amphidinium_carterae.1
MDMIVVGRALFVGRDPACAPDCRGLPLNQGKTSFEACGTSISSQVKRYSPDINDYITVS